MSHLPTNPASPSREGGDLDAGMDVNAANSQVPLYEKVYASIKIEMEVVVRFLMKLERAKGEGKTIHDAETLIILQDTMEKDVKEVSKTAQSIIEKFEHLDKTNTSRKGCKEDSPADETFRNMRSSYITQLEEVLQVVQSVAGVERQSMDTEDSTDNWSNTDSMISMRKMLEGLRKVDSLADAQMQRVDGAEVIQLQGVPKRFNYDQLFMATRGFSEKLGDGGFGSVYRGVLPGHIPVAVKRMNTVVSVHGQGMKEFKSEVTVITQLRHRNLVELRGWCEDPAKKEYMLVYDLMPNGSLDKLMFHLVKDTDPVEQGGAQGRTEGQKPERGRGAGEGEGEGGPVKGTACLSWAQRFKILTRTADALDYLHQGWKHQVIHGDVKCANILLDKEWNAKLTDFGLSRLVDHQAEAYTIHFAGTKGYAAPELFTEGKFTDKSDVFAFGVVVLDVVCGRRNWPADAREKTLVEWVTERLILRDVISTVDKRLREYDRRQIEMVLKIGLACCHIERQKRPSMRLIIKFLAGEGDVELRERMTSIVKKNSSFTFPELLKRRMEVFRGYISNSIRESGVDDGVRTEQREQDQADIYFSLQMKLGGENTLNRIRSSRRRFTTQQAEQRWDLKRQRVHEQSNVKNYESNFPRLKFKCNEFTSESQWEGVCPSMYSLVRACVHLTLGKAGT